MSKKPKLPEGKMTFDRAYTVCLVDGLTGEVLVKGPKISHLESEVVHSIGLHQFFDVRVLPVGVDAPEGYHWNEDSGEWRQAPSLAIKKECNAGRLNWSVMVITTTTETEGSAKFADPSFVSGIRCSHCSHAVHG